ncbi:transcriptional regulator, TetR family [Streptomyces zhaozhouensis]|uniref:Transcriptional regulator, TetR family n=1 Tax=Streptomyces zhaozhouensis TaxID=1300267 RepID=A0A286DVZ2_9ACTN|nr:TetR family transcriptional regulator [Streptomyces zhaozhouensis]SOD62847.1 transcriptional regulator, TetR family [Streptomyces zhaozhouensis]
MSTLRDRRRQATETEIEVAAIKLFESRGFEATTCDDIAAAAEVSPRTFYRHGANKEEAAFRTARRFSAALGDELAERAARRRLRLADFEEVIAGILTESATEDWLERMLTVRRLTSHDPALRRIAQLHDAECVERVVERVAQQDGADPEGLLHLQVTAATALTVFRAALDEWAASPPEEERAASLVRIYRRASALLNDEVTRDARR